MNHRIGSDNAYECERRRWYSMDRDEQIDPSGGGFDRTIHYRSNPGIERINRVPDDGISADSTTFVSLSEKGTQVFHLQPKKSRGIDDPSANLPIEKK